MRSSGPQTNIQNEALPKVSLKRSYISPNTYTLYVIQTLTFIKKILSFIFVQLNFIFC
jgi:hypothetical protein